MTPIEDLIQRLHGGATASRDVGTHMKKYQALCDEAADYLTAALRVMEPFDRPGREIDLDAASAIRDWRNGIMKERI